MERNSNVIFLVVGVLLLIAAAVYKGNASSSDAIPSAGAACGFAIAGGLCFVASAIAQRKGGGDK